MQTRTVRVSNLSDLATEREIHEFFSFSGEIENIEVRSESRLLKTAFVTFRDEKALEIAVLLSDRERMGDKITKQRGVAVPQWVFQGNKEKLRRVPIILSSAHI